MKIIISESQYKLISEGEYLNFKPAEHIDNLIGTNISKKYDRFPLGLTDDEIWDMFEFCWDKKKNCNQFFEVADSLDETYIDIPNLGNMGREEKISVLLGMASRFNEDDIKLFLSFPHDKKTSVIDLYPYSEELKKIEAEIGDNIQWFPSKKTLDKIMKHLNF